MIAPANQLIAFIEDRYMLTPTAIAGS